MHTPPELARALLRHGTTTIVADPHEITNVLGMQGIRFMLGASNCLPVDFFMIPSCVPAIHMETAGAQFAAEDLLILKGKSRVLILAEVMNYQGVLACLEPVLNEIKAFNGSVQDGHASLLASRNLNTYITEDIGSDPECAQIEETQEENKARHACHDPQRDASKKPQHPASPVSPATANHFSLVMDDTYPHDLKQKGHMNHLTDHAVEEGFDQVMAIQMATFSTACYFGLKDRGAVVSGYQADVLVLSSHEPVVVTTVFKKGCPVYDGGQLLADIKLLAPSASYCPR